MHGAFGLLWVCSVVLTQVTYMLLSRCSQTNKQWIKYLLRNGNFYLEHTWICQNMHKVYRPLTIGTFWSSCLKENMLKLQCLQYNALQTEIHGNRKAIVNDFLLHSLVCNMLIVVGSQWPEICTMNTLFTIIECWCKWRFNNLHNLLLIRCCRVFAKCLHSSSGERNLNVASNLCIADHILFKRKVKRCFNAS